MALFSNERHFEIWFPKKRTIMFFWSKLSKLHKKDVILHVATTFSLKQGETRTSHGPIPHPLSVKEGCYSFFLYSVSLSFLRVLCFSFWWGLRGLGTLADRQEPGPADSKKKYSWPNYGPQIWVVTHHSPRLRTWFETPVLLTRN